MPIMRMKGKRSGGGGGGSHRAVYDMQQRRVDSKNSEIAEKDRIICELREKVEKMTKILEEKGFVVI